MAFLTGGGGAPLNNLLSSSIPSVDETIARFDGITGLRVEDSTVTLSDTAVMTFPVDGLILGTGEGTFDIGNGLGGGNGSPGFIFAHDLIQCTLAIKAGAGDGAGFTIGNAMRLSFSSSEAKLQRLGGNNARYRLSDDAFTLQNDVDDIDLLWNGDGGGDIGKAADNRPDTIYAATAVIANGVTLTGAGPSDTDGLPEGAVNFYYTEARFDSSFSGKSTTDLSEGTNLYYTQARFDSAFAAEDTDGLSEGVTNLYYTEARVSANTDVAANTADRHTEVTPGGADTQVQFNNSGAFAGDSGFVYDSGTSSIVVGGDIKAEGQAYSAQDTETQAASAAHTIDFSDGNSTVWDLQAATGDVTLTLSNGVAGASYIIKIIQSSTARDVTWPASVLWAGGTAPVISTADDAEDVIALYFDGTNYYGNFGQDFS